MAIHRLEELTWSELRRLGQAGALFLLPIGPIEDHGPHLPAGVDWITARELTRELALLLEASPRAVPVVLGPCLALGASLFGGLGCLRLPTGTMGEVVESLGMELAAQGVRRAAIITTHGAPGHLLALDRACSRVSRKTRMNFYSPCKDLIFRFLSGAYRQQIEEALGRSLSEETWSELSADYHAGAWETSLLLRYRPELVRDFFRELPRHAVEAGSFGVRGLTTHRGYFGSPALASSDLGDAASTALVSQAAALIESRLLVERPRRGTGKAGRLALGAGALVAAAAVGLAWRNRSVQAG